MAVRFGGNVHLFEFKVVEMAGEGAALAQLREKDCAAKYRGGVRGCVPGGRGVQPEDAQRGGVRGGGVRWWADRAHGASDVRPGIGRPGNPATAQTAPPPPTCTQLPPSHTLPQ